MIGRIITGGLEILSGLLLVALMFVTGVDVVGRYFLDRPLPGAFEMTELLLATLVFAALPLVSRKGEHVEVDLLAALLPARLSRPLPYIAATVAALVLGVFAWRLYALGLNQFHDGVRSISLHIPFSPVAFFGAASCLIAAIYGFTAAARMK